MLKLKIKPTGVKSKEEVKPIITQPEIKEKKGKAPAKKVVYISKRGGKAIFDSISICAKIFDVNESTIKYKIEHPIPKRKYTLKGGDWLKGAKLEYYNN